MNVQDCKTELTERMFPFWTSLIDRENGGFFGEHDGTKVNRKALKGSIYHARILWFFATGEKVLQNKAFAEYADHAYAFICNNCIDKTSGGVYWALDYTGKPADTDKHAYAAAFTLYALAAYYRVRKSVDSLAAAKAVFNCLETKFKTDIAFNEQYDQDWNLLPNKKLAHESGGSKTMNTLLHIMEAYTEFCVAVREVSGDSAFSSHVTQCLESVYSIIMQKVLKADNSRMDLFFDDALTVCNNDGVVTKSFGHDIEATWLLTEAARALGCLDADKNRFLALADITLAEGFDGEALCNEGFTDADGKKRIDSDRIWWVHAETIVAMQNAFELTQGLTDGLTHDGTKYLKISAAVWAYIKSTVITTKSEQSEWLWGIKKDGSVFNATLASMWKCPYHNGRMFYELIKRGAEF
ncbi:MAG: cellobiose 2-epimerase [Treponemataceae bacterium]|nr:MAG: cellobiose 2-epimerase [Treponemataceae bacterium]